MKAWKGLRPEAKLKLVIVAGWFAPQVSRLTIERDETLPLLSVFAGIGLFGLAIYFVNVIKAAAQARGRDEMFADLMWWKRLKDEFDSVLEPRTASGSECSSKDDDQGETSGRAFKDLAALIHDYDSPPKPS